MGERYINNSFISFMKGCEAANRAAPFLMRGLGFKL